MNIKQSLQQLTNKKKYSTGDFQTLRKHLPTLMSLLKAAEHCVETGEPNSLQGVLDYINPPKKDPAVLVDAIREEGGA